MTPRSVTTPSRRESANVRTSTRRGATGTSTRSTSGGSTTQVATTGAILTECIETCNETLSYCLEQGGDHADRDHILSLLDCADTCWYVTGLQSRDSSLVGEALQICATACKACEESCEEFGDDETMTRCADACRQAYEYCSR